MWLTIPDSYQVHMLDRDLINYATGGAGSGIVLPTASQIASSAPTDPVIIQTLAALTALAVEAQKVVVGRLSGQGVLIDPLPTPNASADLLLHVTEHIAFEHLFLRIPGQGSEFPSAWDKAIKEAHATLAAFVDGTLPLDRAFFARGDSVNVPPQQAVVRNASFVDQAFSRDWTLFPNRWAR
jgi:hypothetical protein